MVSDWKERGPEHYAPVQRELLLLAGRMLRPGGLLLYSTCTFSEQEDEGAAAWLLAEAPYMEQVALPVAHGFVQGRDGASVRLYPWKVKGEGHFAALFRKKKDGPDDGDRSGEGAFACRHGHNETFLKKQTAFAGFREKILAPLEERGFYWEKNGGIYLLPVSPDGASSGNGKAGAVRAFSGACHVSEERGICFCGGFFAGGYPGG